ncbi:MAG: hypothetical protein H6837_03615 [Planctomycetes bacterium]|nr:hypothetical protein [Planctomycetota bacterium]
MLLSLDPGYVIAGFVLSTIGFSVFLYGKRQLRVPQLVAGMLLMAIPLALHNPWLLAAAGTTVVAALWGCVRAGW